MNSAQPQMARFTVTAQTAALSGLRRQIRHAMEQEQWSGTVIDAVVLALDEACANLVRHAFHNDPQQAFTVTLQLDAHAAHVEICDTAAPFNPSDYLPQDVSAYLDEHRTEKPGHGLGIVLMTALMDNVHYTPATQPGGINCLTLTKRRG